MQNRFLRTPGPPEPLNELKTRFYEISKKSQKLRKIPLKKGPMAPSLGPLSKTADVAEPDLCHGPCDGPSAESQETTRDGSR